jgi:hypothetical protein
MGRAMADLATELMLNPRFQVRHIIDSGRLRGGYGSCCAASLINLFSVSKYLVFMCFFEKVVMGYLILGAVPNIIKSLK